jgi:ElaB/YqjD/DUF883 family membrane-anchored ribosome-binding protein
MAELTKDAMKDLKNTGKQTLDSGKSMYQDARSQSPVAQFNDQIVDSYKTIRKTAESAVQTSESFIKDHPVYTVLGATALGFVAGMIARRSRQ